MAAVIGGAYALGVTAPAPLEFPRLTGWFSPPVFEDPELTERSRVFHGVALTTLVLVNFVLPVIALVQPDTLLRLLFSLGVQNTLLFTTLALNRRGRAEPASRLYLAVILALLTFNAFTAGGIRSPGVQAYFIFVMLGGLLLGERAGVITACVCAALSLSLVLLEAFGVVAPETRYGPFALWVLTCVYIGVAFMTMRVATGAVRRSLSQARVELAERRTTQNRLQERVKELRFLHESAQALSEGAEFDRDTLTKLVSRMPAAWMYVDDCRARITYRDMDVASDGWRSTPWCLDASFDTSKGRGTVEVVYLTEHPIADEGPFLHEERALLHSFVEMLRSHIERQATEERRRTLEAELLREREQAAEARFSAMLDERNRIARELHDTLLQGFTGVGLKLVAVANRMEGTPVAAEAVRVVIADAQRTLESARRAIWDMRPAPSPGKDFVATLRTAVEDSLRGTDLHHEFVVEGAAQAADPDVETAVFRVTLEAIANVLKHAAARSVRVVLTYEPTCIVLSVTDNGRGFVVDPDFRAYSGHLGLLGMHERASQAHGTLTVRSSDGHGTEVGLVVPLSTSSSIES
jgi:signal transduction histidine kinase